MDYFDKQNEVFFDFLNTNFISRRKTWDEIANSITLEKVKRTYKCFSELFPRNFNYVDELNNAKSSFSSLHYGQLRGNNIINEVVRFSLYSEKIIVFHPLQNPSITNHSLDPRKKPKHWLPDFLEALYFYVTIQKWVKSRIIKLIINPIEYDIRLRETVLKETKARVAKLDKEAYIALDGDSVTESLAEQMALNYKGRNKQFIVEKLLQMQQPYFSRNEAVEFADRIIAAVPNINPLYNKLNIPLTGRMITTTKGGGSLESMILISKYTEANIYTPSASNWQQIKEMGLDDFWLKVNHIYSKIELPFLNKVDTNFALELRQQDRLAGVRLELRKIYSELNSITIENLSESKIRLLQEGFLESLKSAENEWADIKKQAENARKYWLSANVGIPIVNNEISLMPLILGSLTWLYFNEKSANQKQTSHRIKNPISVFVDLKHKQQGFFSILKNSLI